MLASCGEQRGGHARSGGGGTAEGDGVTLVRGEGVMGEGKGGGEGKEGDAGNTFK